MTISNNKLLIGASGGGGQDASNYLVTVQKSGGVVAVLDHTTPGSLSSSDTIAIGGSGNDGYSAQWASDDSFIVAGSEGNPQLHLIDSSNYGSLSSTDTFNTTIRSRAIALRPDDTSVAVGHVDGSANFRIFAISSGSLALDYSETLPNGTSSGSVESIDWSPNGTYLAILARPASGYSFLHLYSVPATSTGPPSFIASYDGGNNSGGTFSGCTRFSPDGNYVACTFNNNLRVFSYNGSSLTLVATQAITGSGTFQSLAWNPDSSELAATAGGNKRLHLYQWDPTTSEEDRLQDGDSTYTLPAVPGPIAWTADGKYIACASNNGIELINADDHTNLTQAARIADSSYNTNGDRIDWSNN